MSTRVKRQYSDADKATALAALEANAGNVKGTARTLEIPSNTLDEWAKGRNQHPDVTNLRNDKTKELAQKLDEIAHKIADAMPDKIEKAGLKDCSVSLGVTIDKARLIREQPTSITQSQDIEDAAQRIVELLNRGRARRLELVKTGTDNR